MMSLLPLPIYFLIIGLILVGLGCAPIYPCMLHETPTRFGKNALQSIMGFKWSSHIWEVCLCLLS